MGLDKLNVDGFGFIESFDSRYPTRILETLLKDRSNDRNIIWADNEYEDLGQGYMRDDWVTVDKITGFYSGVIKPRIAKENSRRFHRTKIHAEVFTPSWLCNQMNNDIDADWFGTRSAFNVENKQTWTTTSSPVSFPKKKGHGWHAYVESPRIEIACGEGPFVCSRYDAVSGEQLPVGKRIGFLDRKLRIVTEKTKTRKEWVNWALAALKASYGFEYQGDNLLLARINVFETFCEHLQKRWNTAPTTEEMIEAAYVISWNFWQMNGITCAAPGNKMDRIVHSKLFDYRELKPDLIQPQLFGFVEKTLFDQNATTPKRYASPKKVPLCVIYDWLNNKPIEFASLKGGTGSVNKKFYAVIGNPPYQEEFNDDGNRTYAKPVYNDFMDAAEDVADRVELITPARFLFNAGSTPKAWNTKKLADPHFKVLQYEADASKEFPNTDIKGGVAVTLRDRTKLFGPVGTFIPDNNLRSIYKKVTQSADFETLERDVHSRTEYRLTDAMHRDNPFAQERQSSGHLYDMSTNIITLLPEIFSDKKPEDSHEYIKILGLLKMKRVYRYIRRDYVNEPDSLFKWKVFLPKSNGSGALDEVPSTPLIGQPLIGQPSTGHTETFISIGCFETEQEAQSLLKYIKTKFARVLLGILKTTQDNPPEKWKFIPLQNFTITSDINWQQPVSTINQQLYSKYKFDQEEINFVESHVKEMD